MDSLLAQALPDTPVPTSIPEWMGIVSFISLLVGLPSLLKWFAQRHADGIAAFERQCDAQRKHDAEQRERDRAAWMAALETVRRDGAEADQRLHERIDDLAGGVAELRARKV